MADAHNVRIERWSSSSAMLFLNTLMSTFSAKEKPCGLHVRVPGAIRDCHREGLVTR